MCSAIASLFAQFVLVQRFRLGTRFLVYAGIGVALVSNLLVILAIMSPNYGLIAFALVLSGLGFGMLRPGFAGASSLAVSPDEQGAMAGLTGGAGAAGFIFAPLIGNALYGLDPTLPYILGTVLMGTLLVYLMRSRTLKSAIIRDRADLIDPHPPA
jgi:MFS family permease